MSNELISYNTEFTGDATEFADKYSVHGVNIFKSPNDGVNHYAIGSCSEISHKERDFDKLKADIKGMFENISSFGSSEKNITPKVFGGFSFANDSRRESQWGSFENTHFVLPKILITEEVGKKAYLSLYTFCNSNENVTDVRDSLVSMVKDENFEQFLQKEISKESKTKSDIAQLDKEQNEEYWIKLLSKAIARMKAEDFKKVVLARSVERETSMSPFDVLASLEKDYQNSYRFLFNPKHGEYFVGASPELLAKLKGKYLETMALAGTTSKGKTKEEELKLAEELLASQKDRHEHDLVVQSIKRALLPISDSIMLQNSPEILRIGSIQHLHTPVKARVHDGKNIIDLIKILHPTPALGGEPRDVALKFIEEEEMLDRGWYAAPVGWIDSNLDGQFAVAIRSAYVKNNILRMFAGAGILSSSDPNKEWEETELKLSPMKKTFKVNK